MLRLIRAEFLKLRSTQVWFWLLLASIALTVLGTIGQIAGSNGDFDLQSHVRDVFTSASNAYIALFVLGVLAVTTEYRYQTITPTVLATPSRWSIVGAKAITYLISGIAYGVVCLAVEFAVAVPWLNARNISAPLGDQVGAIAVVLGVVALMSLVGLGAGALMKNQIVAVSVGLVVLLVLENLVLVIPKVRRIWSYLPGGAITSMTTSRNSDRRTHDVHLLPVWGGTLTLIIWALVMAAIGAAITMRRDIT